MKTGKYFRSFFILIFFLVNFNLVSCKQTLQNKLSENAITEKTTGGRDSAEYITESVADNLYVPWSIIFTDKDRLLFTERNGKLRVIENGKLNSEPLKAFDEVSSNGEEGLMGLAADPSYPENKFIYISYAYLDKEDMKVKVVRCTDNGNSLSDEKIIIDNLPAERYHAGCRLKFGPDGKLYVTTGDAGERELAQDINTLYGKILRINPDGTVPSDNPFKNNPVWSYGHRNPQGIDWYPGTDILYSTEHGPSGFDGPGGGDEVNVIVKGGNYGWPEVSHKESREGMISPVLEFTPAVAPASGMFYKSDLLPQFRNNFFFGCLRGSGIMRVVVDSNNPLKIISFEKMFSDKYGRIREITESPEGEIYFSTSNRDGRGKVRDGDDKIYRITKK
ncbi:MAG: PQQ-dependent sugar dehydrogenase [Ignavibacteria bacterium]|nr:PQQ-dependent sugar dehydrogenase [Ignavibacteria bacterium]